MRKGDDVSTKVTIKVPHEETTKAIRTNFEKPILEAAKLFGITEIEYVTEA